MPSGEAARAVQGAAEGRVAARPVHGLQRSCQRQVADHRDVRGGAVRLHPCAGRVRVQDAVLQAEVEICVGRVCVCVCVIYVVFMCEWNICLR